MQSNALVLSSSISREDLTDLFATVGDTTIDAAISSGVLDGVPILGIVTGLFRAGKGIHEQLYLKKIVKFLNTLGSTSPAARTAFTQKLQQDGETETFGETILLILDKCEDMQKPVIVGRLIAAHIDGHIDFAHAMRLVAITNRAYSPDLLSLKTFVRGVQGANTPVAESLFAAGLLSDGGIDGGGFDQVAQPGGTLYYINTYGELMLAHGLV